MASAGEFDPYHKWLGIPAEEQPPHHYRLLGLRIFEADPDVIQSAADQRMSHVRTFQNGRYSEASQRLLNEIAAAKVCLLKTGRKTAYDAELRTQLEAATPASSSRAIPVAKAIPVPSIAEVFDPWEDDLTTARRRRRRKKGPSRAPLWIFLTVAALGVIVAAVWFAIYGSELLSQPEHSNTPTNNPSVPPIAARPSTPGDPIANKSDSAPTEATAPTASNPPLPAKSKKAPLAHRRMPSTIDDGDAGFGFDGEGWLREEQVAGAFKKTHHFHPASSESATAEWKFDGLEEGKQYDVFATWRVTEENTTEAHYRVTGIVDEPQEITINQREAPRGATRVNGHVFQKLGTFTSLTSTLTVQISSRTDGFISADAVLVNSADPAAAR